MAVATTTQGACARRGAHLLRWASLCVLASGCLATPRPTPTAVDDVEAAPVEDSTAALADEGPDAAAAADSAVAKDSAPAHDTKGPKDAAAADAHADIGSDTAIEDAADDAPEDSVEEGAEVGDDAATALADLPYNPKNSCPPPPDGSQKALHVLFIGNSYTYVNDLPGTFANLATAGGRMVQVESVTNGGWTLGAAPNAFANDPTTTAKLAGGGWDVVVLQDQSEIPSIPSYFQSTTIPGATNLDAKIHAASPCARTVFYETWGRKDGNATFATYADMQDALSAAYQTLGKLLGAEVAPVGEAWRIVRKNHPEIELYQSDGSHPSLQGTYLAACTFYGRVFAASPVGLPTPDGATSVQLQNAALGALAQQP